MSKKPSKGTRRSPIHIYSFFLFSSTMASPYSLRSVLGVYSLTFEEMQVLCLLYVELQNGNNYTKLSRVNAILINQGGLKSEEVRKAVNSLVSKRYINTYNSYKAQTTQEGRAVVNSIYAEFFKTFEHFTKKSVEDVFPENPEIH